MVKIAIGVFSSLLVLGAAFIGCYSAKEEQIQYTTTLRSAASSLWFYCVFVEENRQNMAGQMQDIDTATLTLKAWESFLVESSGEEEFKKFKSYTKETNDKLTIFRVETRIDWGEQLWIVNPNNSERGNYVVALGGNPRGYKRHVMVFSPSAPNRIYFGTIDDDDDDMESMFMRTVSSYDWDERYEPDRKVWKEEFLIQDNIVKSKAERK